jgi:hypothetical protein
MNNDRVCKEHGAGWNDIVDQLNERLTEMGGTVHQIKEKFGSLRYYYTGVFGTQGATEQDWDDFEDAVDAAEQLSKRTCEMCGKAGKLMAKGYWFKTLCSDDATTLEYKEYV